MFIENYRSEEPLLGGGSAHTNDVIPYPRISDEDWKIWSTFLPVRTAISEDFLTDPNSGLYAQTLPREIRHEFRSASRFFDRVEVWGKRKIELDPIAVGYQGNDRYLIARWGMAKLLPFAAMKKRRPLVLAWRYGIGALGLLAGFAVLSILGYSLIA